MFTNLLATFSSMFLPKFLSYCSTRYHVSCNFLLDDWCKSSEFGQCEHVIQNWQWEMEKYLEWMIMDLQINYLIILVCNNKFCLCQKLLNFFFFFNFEVEFNLMKTLSWLCPGTVTKILLNSLKRLQEDCSSCCLWTAAYRLLRFSSLNTLGQDLLPYIF